MLADTVGPPWPRQWHCGVECTTPNSAPASPTSHTGATTTPCAASVFPCTVNLICATVLCGSTLAPSPITCISGTLVGPSSAWALDFVPHPSLSRQSRHFQLPFTLLPSPSPEAKVMGTHSETPHTQTTCVWYSQQLMVLWTMKAHHKKPIYYGRYSIQFSYYVTEIFLTYHRISSIFRMNNLSSSENCKELRSDLTE